MTIVYLDQVPPLPSTLGFLIIIDCRLCNHSYILTHNLPISSLHHLSPTVTHLQMYISTTSLHCYNIHLHAIIAQLYLAGHAANRAYCDDDGMPKYRERRSQNHFRGTNQPLDNHCVIHVHGTIII